MVVKSPAAIPPITEEAVTQIAKPLSDQPMMSEVTSGLATVAGTPSARITATMAVKDIEGKPLDNHMTMYVVPAEKAGGFFVYFYSTQPGDPRDDIKKIMDSFDPAYRG
jgi:hypothetical protein